MRILIDIIHPADIHFFKYAIYEWSNRGHKILITARDKDIALQLLRAYGFEFTCISSQARGLYKMAYELIDRDLRLYRLAKKFIPDVLIGFTGISISHVAKLIRKPSIVFYDTEFARLSNSLTYPLSTLVCTPDCYNGKIGKKHIRFPGYKELAYLHPSRFEPKREILKKLNLPCHRKIFIIRFVSLEAAHDVWEKGISYQNRLRLVDELSQHGEVFISSEGDLQKDFDKYRLSIDIERLHDLMACAYLYVGESATMASECAVLGIPAICITTTGRGYTVEQEKKYGLVYNFSDMQQEEAFAKVKELMTYSDLRDEWIQRRERMLLEKVDVTTWMVEFIERYIMDKRWARI